MQRPISFKFGRDNKTDLASSTWLLISPSHLKNPQCPHAIFWAHESRSLHFNLIFWWRGVVTWNATNPHNFDNCGSKLLGQSIMVVETIKVKEGGCNGNINIYIYVVRTGQSWGPARFPVACTTTQNPCGRKAEIQGTTGVAHCFGIRQGYRIMCVTLMPLQCRVMWHHGMHFYSWALDHVLCLPVSLAPRSSIHCNLHMDCPPLA